MNMRVSVSPGAALEESQNIAASVSPLRGANQMMGSDRDVTEPRWPHAEWGCTDTLHELANSLTAVLINIQILEWKLPLYSRLKRPAREIELHARRSEALFKRLLREFEIHLKKESKQEFVAQAPFLRGTNAAVTAQGPAHEGAAKLPPQMESKPALGPDFSPKTKLTSVCDPCTSAFFPKEEP